MEDFRDILMQLHFFFNYETTVRVWIKLLCLVANYARNFDEMAHNICIIHIKIFYTDEHLNNTYYLIFSAVLQIKKLIPI